jgi:hypothetical protein
LTLGDIKSGVIELLKFLKEKLELDLKDPYVLLISVYKGIDFLGYFIKPSHTLVRRRVVKNLNKKILEKNYKLKLYCHIKSLPILEMMGEAMSLKNSIYI